MNDAEWKQCKVELFSLFPSLATWADGLDPKSVDGKRTTAGREAMNRRWLLALASYDASDVMDAIRTVATAAESPWPFPSDYERAGAILADVIRRKRNANAPPAEYDQLGLQRPKRRGAYDEQSTFGRVLREIDASTNHAPECVEHRKARGKCLPTCPVPSDVARRIAAEATNLPEDRQTFGCGICRDTGYVSCYGSRDVYWIGKLRRLPLFPRTYAVQCSCRVGQGRKSDERYATFDRSRDVPIHQPRTETITACVAIYEQFENKPRHVESDGRVNVFDQFNDGVLL